MIFLFRFSLTYIIKNSKPSKHPSGYFAVDELDKDASLVFSLPDNFKSDYINNSKLKHAFR